MYIRDNTLFMAEQGVRRAANLLITRAAAWTGLKQRFQNDFFRQLPKRSLSA